jgi:protoporphyrinogen/coproporphyrinogen III oxidase
MAIRVAIVGGGISGLSSAYYLAKAGIAPVLIEARPRLGGVIRTEHVEGCVVEAGPDSFLSVKPAAMELIGELGLTGEVIGSNDHLRKTYVWKQGRLVALPDGLMMMIPTRILPMVTTPLVSWSTKFRMGAELFRGPRNGSEEDGSVADFVEKHYGAEAVDYLAEPLLAGIYGGSPRQLSVRSVLPRFVELEEKYGSLTRGVLAERRRAAAQANHLPLFRTLKGGLQQLVGAVAASIEGKVEVVYRRAEALERTAGGFRIRVDGDWLEAEQVVLACEAHQAAILAPEAGIRDLLAAVPYGSSMTMALGFQASDFPRPLAGFGFLVPKRERRRLVACTWVGTKFSHRVPQGRVLLRCFLGGTDDAAVLEESDAAVTEAVLEELHRIVGFSARPSFVRVFRWPRSMAQYAVGHQRRLVELKARLGAVPGLHLAGNAYEGIGIPDCIRTGKQAAEAIANSI